MLGGHILKTMSFLHAHNSGDVSAIPEAPVEEACSGSVFTMTPLRDPQHHALLSPMRMVSFHSNSASNLPGTKLVLHV